MTNKAQTVRKNRDLVAAALREAKHRPGYDGDEELLEELAQIFEREDIPDVLRKAQIISWVDKGGN